MVHSRASRPASTNVGAFDAQAYLDSSVAGTSVREYRRGETVFREGDREADVLYVRTGGVQLSMRSSAGCVAAVGMAGPGDFFGEGCLIAQPLRLATAVSMTDAAVMRVEKAEMLRLLHAEPDFAEAFTVHLLTRNSRVEADLADHLFNSSEKRLARALLLLTNFRHGGNAGAHHRENQPGNARGNDWDDPAPRQHLHEQVQKPRLH